MNTTDLKSFHYLENGEISFSMLSTIKTSEKLDSGFYQLYCVAGDYGKPIATLKIEKNSEKVNIHNFPDKPRIEEVLKAFHNPVVVENIKRLGYYRKLGVLFYGSEGTGKSTIVRYYAKQLIEDYQAIVFYCNDPWGLSQMWSLVKSIREIQTNPIVVIFEEFDNFTKNNESYLKTMLDGNLAVDNSVIFATTNYIEDIPNALKQRPSRFKYCFNIEGIQDPAEIFSIIKTMLEETYSILDIHSFVEELIGYSLDNIKQFCLDKIMHIGTIKTTARRKIGFTTSK